MKRLILVLLLTLPSFARAEVIPPGCYVADYYRLDPCWNASDNLYEWVGYSNRTTGVGYYGGTVEAIIHKNELNKSDLSSCLTAYGNLQNQYNANDAGHVNNYNALYGEYSKVVDSANALLKKRDTLIKKLRKACGNACKKIK